MAIIIIVVIAIVVLAALGVGMYFIFKKKGTSPTTLHPSSTFRPMTLTTLSPAPNTSNGPVFTTKTPSTPFPTLTLKPYPTFSGILSQPLNTQVDLTKTFSFFPGSDMYTLQETDWLASFSYQLVRMGDQGTNLFMFKNNNSYYGNINNGNTITMDQPLQFGINHTDQFDPNIIPFSLESAAVDTFYIYIMYDQSKIYWRDNMSTGNIEAKLDFLHATPFRFNTIYTPPTYFSMQQLINT